MIFPIQGACLIWMLFNFLGEPVTQAGLQSYLANKYVRTRFSYQFATHVKCWNVWQRVLWIFSSYGTGTPDQLWQSLTTANNNTSNSILPLHVDIGTVMDTWTNQKGYPLVTVTRNYTSAIQEISQVRPSRYINDPIIILCDLELSHLFVPIFVFTYLDTILKTAPRYTSYNLILLQRSLETDLTLDISITSNMSVV